MKLIIQLAFIHVAISTFHSVLLLVGIHFYRCTKVYYSSLAEGCLRDFQLLTIGKKQYKYLHLGIVEMGGLLCFTLGKIYRIGMHGPYVKGMETKKSTNMFPQ